MKKILILLICLLSFEASVFCAAKDKFVVVIDAGHGGRDPGTIRGKYKEKEINLAVALALGDLVNRNYNDVEVVYTRKTDKYLTLIQRSQIANKAKANLFISIHTNATDAKNTTASGADTYILGLHRSAENMEVAKRENSVILLEDDYSTKYEGFDPKQPESYIIFEFMSNKYMEQSLVLASHIQSGFRNVAKRKDRGVHQAGFLVLRESGMPSVLIELGFINNANEAKFLYTTTGRSSMANAIFSGFKKYKQDIDKKRGVLSPIQPSVEAKPAKEEKSDTTISPKTETVAKNDIRKDEVEYRVQFLISPKKFADGAAAFKGLSPITYYQEGSTYKYTYGSTTSFSEITKVQRQVRTKFKDCFVVKFKNGQRIK